MTRFSCVHKGEVETAAAEIATRIPGRRCRHDDTIVGVQQHLEPILERRLRTQKEKSHVCHDATPTVALSLTLGCCYGRAVIVTVTCPACWQPTAVELAGYEGRVEQYEDCQVCCRPMRIRARLTADYGDDPETGQLSVADLDVQLDG